MSAYTPAPHRPSLDSAQASTSLGFVALAVTVCIWAGFFVSLRAGAQAHLPVAELALLRFGPSGLLFAPLLWRRRRRVWAVGVPSLMAMIVGAGLPYFLIVGEGLRFAPVSDGSTLVPGTIPLAVALLLHLRGQPTALPQWKALGVIGVGVLMMLAFSFWHGAPGLWRGELIFLLCSLLWANYTVALRHSGLTPLEAAALLSTGSLLGLLAWWPFSPELRGLQALRALPAHALWMHGLIQGVGVGLISTFSYGVAITRLGAQRTAVGGALTPVLATGLAWLILGEWPQPVALAGMALIVFGVVRLNRRSAS
ncbi:DMT family transporter [Thiomonas intermedia]|uniref:DMT family transporter n=1 Tax=Thiomonas intermedia TaxID=926 RepID=UPI0009A4FA10|nr:DMT family transporter [Thiomonas intermedia]